MKILSRLIGAFIDKATHFTYPLYPLLISFLSLVNTAFSKLALYLTILFWTGLLLAPKICAARIPAFLAALTATVATGTPFGICKIDSIESQPSIELLDLIGTPITGSGDRLATIPGR